jgi:DNA-binding LytR/AlgR family response regulator
MKRIEEFMEIRLKANLFESSLAGDAFYIKTGHNQVKVKLHEILYLEALKNYTILVTESKRHCVLSNLGEMLQDEKFSSFIRVHRSFAVSKHHISTIKSQTIKLSENILIPIGRNYKNNIEKL